MSVAVRYENPLFDKYVYNHDVMECTADGVIGNFLYSGRALGITNPGDKIQIDKSLQPFWLDITIHYDRVGLSYSKDVIWELNIESCRAFPEHQLSVFFFGEQEYKAWGDEKWYKTVNYINSKNNFISLANQLNIKVPKTVCFESANNINHDLFNHLSYPCYLKASVSVSGIGIFRCESADDLRLCLNKFEPDCAIQIQDEIQSNLFLNLQYMVYKTELVRLAASEQILKGFMHQGNRVPSRYAPWSCVDDMALWLKDKGMKGIFAFDVAVVETNYGQQFYAIECNPRFNGASYPTLIAKKLGIFEWSALTFSTKYRCLKDIDLQDIEFNPDTGEGVILVNWGTILVGKLVFLLAGSTATQKILTKRLYALLN